MKTFKQFIEEESRKIWAKKIQDAPEWRPGLGEDDYKVGEVIFSAKDGLGAVPDNQSVYYKGFVAMMRPSMFRAVVLAEDHQGQTAREIAKLMLDGYALGPPFLDLDTGDFERGEGFPHIVGHEGRGRMRAIQMANGDEPVPVHVFLRGGSRARHLAPVIEQLKTTQVKIEGSNEMVNGLFKDIDWRP